MATVSDFYDAGHGFTMFSVEASFTDDGELEGYCELTRSRDAMECPHQWDAAARHLGCTCVDAFERDHCRCTLSCDCFEEPGYIGEGIEDGALIDADGPHAPTTVVELQPGVYMNRRTRSRAGVGVGIGTGPDRWRHEELAHDELVRTEQRWLAKPTSCDPPLWGEYRTMALLRQRKFEQLRRWLRVQAVAARAAARKRNTDRLRVLQRRVAKLRDGINERYAASCRRHCPRKEWAHLYLTADHMATLRTGARYVLSL